MNLCQWFLHSLSNQVGLSASLAGFDCWFKNHWLSIRVNGKGLVTNSRSLGTYITLWLTWRLLLSLELKGIVFRKPKSLPSILNHLKGCFYQCRSISISKNNIFKTELNIFPITHKMGSCFKSNLKGLLNGLPIRHYGCARPLGVTARPTFRWRNDEGKSTCLTTRLRVWSAYPRQR